MKRSKSKCIGSEPDLFAEFHPKPICQIVRTNTQFKPNAFSSLRPAYACEYHISQTDIKLDAGPTKIHMQQTFANYESFTEPSLPPRPKKHSCSSGGPAQWKMVDEIWREKQKRLQKIYHQQFEERIRKTRILQKSQRGLPHNRLLAMVGPEWFQELSPKQLAAIDRLKTNLLLDLALKSTRHVHEILAILGIVPRPSPKILEEALKLCCPCPSDFLLVLYQLKNPNRQKYSLNDRLLLSAVVHLQMRDTLKELHIRIPSPPPPQKKLSKPPKKKKVLKYSSPYLEPFVFEREPRKYTGVYYNKHLQHPESPYFSYLESLNKALLNENPSSTNEDPDLVEETQEAQKIYEKLADYSPVRQLLVPSLYPKCIKTLKRKSEVPPLTKEEDEVVTVSLIYVEDKNDTNIEESIQEDETFSYSSSSEPSDSEDDTTEESTESSETFTESTESAKGCRERAKKIIEKEICQCEKCMKKRNLKGSRYNDQIIENVSGDELIIDAMIDTNDDDDAASPEELSIKDSEVSEEELEEPVVEEEKIEKICVCTTNEQKEKVKALRKKLKKALEESQDDQIINGVVSIKDDPISGIVAKKEKNCVCSNGQQTENPPIKKPKSLKAPPANCIISGVANTRRGPVYIISGMVVNEESSEEEEHVEKKSKKCICKKKKKKESKKKRKKADPEPLLPDNLIISGIANTDEGPVYIVSGVYSMPESYEPVPRKMSFHYIDENILKKQTCSCLQSYQSKIKAFEEYRKRIKAITALRQQENQYIINGVSNTPEGPIYNISGIRPTQECKCGKKIREDLEERDRLAKFPKIPRGRINYGIQGVKETSEGNVYILSQALPKKDCTCMEIYDKFEKSHGPCMDLYKNYMEKVNIDINEYMDELNASARQELKATSRARSLLIDDKSLNEQEPSEAEDYLVDLETNSNQKKFEKREEDLRKENLFSTDEPVEIEGYISSLVTSNEELEGSESINIHEDYDDLEETKLKDVALVTSNSQEIGQNFETCTKEVIQRHVCQGCRLRSLHVCKPAESSIEECPLEEIEEPEKIVPRKEVKRFFIFRNLVRNSEWLMDLLKKALATMAEDGYPIAKLPDCHKLPHFKLWLQMRYGKFWNFEEKNKFTLKSKMLWRHTDVCYRHILSPRMTISKGKASQLTWANAKYCRKLANDVLLNYYRKVRQNNVAAGREFFPTTFSYEFPFPTFRDCYFAYTPAKEEEVLAVYVWEPYEKKNFSNRRSCS